MWLDVGIYGLMRRIGVLRGMFGVQRQRGRQAKGKAGRKGKGKEEGEGGNGNGKEEASVARRPTEVGSRAV